MSTIHTSPSENHSPRSSQRLALDSSILKVSQGNLRLSGSGQSTKSAVGFKDDTAKDVKRQKQAWESPPDTPQLSRQSSQKGIEKVIILYLLSPIIIDYNNTINMFLN